MQILSSTADATVILTSFSSDPASVVEGGQINFNASFSVQNTAGYYGESIVGGSIQISSGDGQTETLAITGNSTSVSMIYGGVGSYTATLTGSINTKAFYDSYEIISYQPIYDYRFMHYEYYRCGFSTCSYPVYGYVFVGYQPIYGWQQYTQYFSTPLNGAQTVQVTQASPSPVPEPGMLTLLSFGLAGLGLMLGQSRVLRMPKGGIPGGITNPGNMRLA